MRSRRYHHRVQRAVGTLRTARAASRRTTLVARRPGAQASSGWAARSSGTDPLRPLLPRRPGSVFDTFLVRSSARIATRKADMAARDLAAELAARARARVRTLSTDGV